jgi:hypothetical protein
MLSYVMAHRKRGNIHSGAIAIVSAIGGILRSPIVLAWLFAIAGVVVLAATSVPKLRATRISAADVRVSFQDPPVWLDDSLLLELKDVARIHLAKAPVGRDGLTQTVDALARTGWFADIAQVKWVNSNQVLIDASFLVPYAKVHDSVGIIFIDVHGRKLPTRVGAIVKPTYHFITLDNPEFQRPLRPGLQWVGGDVQAGLSLLNKIYDKPWISQVTSINLAHWVEDGSLILVTNTPSHILWGSAPGEESALEALVDHKIERLNWTNTKFGLIDQGIETEFDLTNTSDFLRK